MSSSAVSGTWVGELESAEYGTEPCRLHISQTWTDIEIELRTEDGGQISKSETASILTKQQSPELRLTYESEPRSENAADRDRHRGTNVLELNTHGDEPKLDGHYYTGPGRKSHGSMIFTKED